MINILRFIIPVILLITQTACSQPPVFDQELIVNKDVFNNINPAKDSIINFMAEYHRRIFKDWTYSGVHWTKESKALYKYPDYMLKQEFAGHDWNKIKPNLIAIFHPDTNYYLAQVGYSYFDTITKNTHPFCVYTFAITKQNDSLKFFPVIETYAFKKYENKSIALYVKDESQDYTYLLDSLQTYNLKLAKLFEISPIKFACYKFTNFDELNTSIGLDVQRNNARSENNAYCDMLNKVIYGTTINCYFHEVVHMYVGNDYVETCHSWINEGLATYLGGSGLTLDQHLHYLAIDLKKHTEYDLSNFLEYEHKHIDHTTKVIWTSYKFTLGGLMSKLVYETKGMSGLKRLLSNGSNDEQLYQTVCKELNIKRKDLNEFLRREVYKYLN
ncbi:MAG: hypothetical protein V4580_04040 [Bacteroidota bacterium]